MSKSRGWTVLTALLLCSLWLGCSSAVPSQPVAVEPVLEQVAATVEVMVRPTATKVPRLDLPTLTPIPTPTLVGTPTPHPTLDLAGDTEVVVLGPGGKLPPLIAPTCAGRVQELLEAHRGKLFPEDVQAYADRAASERGDCGEIVVSFGLACDKGTYIGGLRVDQGFLRNVDRYSRRSIGETRKDSFGNVLVHFEVMPDSDVSGCWYYSAREDRWAWRNVSGEYGQFEIDNSGCDDELREAVLELRAETPVEVAGAVESVWFEFPVCREQGWMPYPSTTLVGDCGLASRPDTVVLHWQAAYLPYDGKQCWAYNRKVGEWYEGY